MQQLILIQISPLQLFLFLFYFILFYFFIFSLFFIFFTNLFFLCVCVCFYYYFFYTFFSFLFFFFDINIYMYNIYKQFWAWSLSCLIHLGSVSKDQSACTSAQSDQSLHWPYAASSCLSNNSHANPLKSLQWVCMWVIGFVTGLKHQDNKPKQ